MKMCGSANGEISTSTERFMNSCALMHVSVAEQFSDSSVQTVCMRGERNLHSTKV